MYSTYGPVGMGISALAERALEASPVPHRSRPDPGDPDWRSVTELCEPATWQELGRRYSHSLGTPHAAPGLLCSLQHYAGRALGLMVAAWCADGTLLHPGHGRWWALIDRAGATLQVSLPDTPVLGREQDPGALVDSIRSHVDPLVDACVDAGTVTRRAALGGIAASCAGAFGAAYRTVGGPRRRAVETDADVVTGAFSDRPLVTMIRLGGTPALVHDRHSCCLIRLGAQRSECDSCPRVPEAQRRSRQRHRQEQQLRRDRGGVPGKSTR
ncbi:hypothetical protein [Dietzia sp. SYD-A1]|uniref:hypothetical protein n=1 Tax=Dietzia sp. SYD-A1 TaxID=2780141 RepID=UPI001891C680|nr:hypothetical protein [Dietzia sp. SYD-A1]